MERAPRPTARDRSQIDRLVRRYASKPVMVIIDVKPKQLGIPTEAYFAVEEVIEGQQLQWTFKHFPSEIGATEAEEVGVEHLLRDVKDMTLSTLANREPPPSPPPILCFEFFSLLSPPPTPLSSWSLTVRVYCSFSLLVRVIHTQA